MASAPIDETKAEAFAEGMVDVLNKAALALMASLGHRTGLFDAMAELPPATSREIADAAGLHERYVREWLGAMVTSGVVEHDPEHETYRLPAEHAACLTRSASPENVAALAQYVPLLGSVEDKVAECFEQGGGVPYSAFPRFHAVMAEDSEQTVVSALVDEILPLAPGVMEALRTGIEVLDVGCGSGRALNLLAETFPNSRFTGYDLSEQAIRAARSQADAAGLDNVRFDIRDLTTFDVEAPADRYDLITAFDAIHDQASPDRVLSGIARALKPNGTFLMQDIDAASRVNGNRDHPIGPFLYTLSCMHCMTVSLAQNGTGLGAMWGEERAREMLDQAGFKSVDAKRLPHDFQNVYYVCTFAHADAARSPGHP